MTIKMFKNKANKMLTRAEAGMVTAEYAIGTVASAGMAGILLWLIKQDWFRELIATLFRNVLGMS
ncbi:hypothetical protein JOD55_000345 [Arcanobacterium pluranimalium]|uniref:DUF4244 domain-containing protein n=1 Tax=Arcanobacterium pluranimalium TaxID=108028 RepID=UPI001EF8EBC0|nr:DUF4244 domain-containing protein [Arcanobacterium pluranimalium]MBM7824518.1 hypothetical protein [Arcanobacterium pluranimalium]